MAYREAQLKPAKAAQPGSPVPGARASVACEYGSYYYWWYFTVPTMSCHAPAKLP